MMKYQLLFWTLTAINFGIDLLPKHPSQAEPASVFQPIIEEIKNQIPSGFKMRLPAFMPDLSEDIVLYSFIPSDRANAINIGESEVFTVFISETPNCETANNPLDCTVGIIGVTESISEFDLKTEDLPEDIVDLTPVELNPAARGFYFVQHKDYQLVLWQQEELTHVLIAEQCAGDCVSKQELIAMAKSAANEPAIASSDSSYYVY